MSWAAAGLAARSAAQHDCHSRPSTRSLLVSGGGSREDAWAAAVQRRSWPFTRCEAIAIAIVPREPTGRCLELRNTAHVCEFG